MTNEATSDPTPADALAAVREERQRALSAFAHDHPDVGMTLAKSARAVEDVLGAIVDPAEAREAFEASLAPDRRLDLLVVMGDIDAVAFTHAAPADAFAAILMALLDDRLVKTGAAYDDTEIQPIASAAKASVRSDPDDDEDKDAVSADEEDEDEEDDRYEPVDAKPGDEVDPTDLLPWIHKLRSRPDYERLLDEVFCRHAFRDWVLIALLAAAGDDDEEVSAHAIDELGLDVRDARERLRQLMPQIDEEYRLNRPELQSELERFRGEMRAPAKTAAQQQVDALKDAIDL